MADDKEAEAEAMEDVPSLSHPSTNYLSILPGINPLTRTLVFRIAVEGKTTKGVEIEEGLGIIIGYDELIILSEQLATLVEQFAAASAEEGPIDKDKLN